MYDNILIMYINIFYFIWILIKTKTIIKTMRYFFDKYDIDTFNLYLLFKTIKFTKERELCEGVLSMESRTTYLSRYFNNYKNHPYALINIDIIDPLYYIIHNALIKSFNKNKLIKLSNDEIIKYFPKFCFGDNIDMELYNELLYLINQSKYNKEYINQLIFYMYMDSKNGFFYDFSKELILLDKNIIIDNIFYILSSFNYFIIFNNELESNKIKYLNQENDIINNTLQNINFNYLCVRQLPFTNEYIFMDLGSSKLFFSYGLKKCLFYDIFNKNCDKE
jgi:hypothetical protein